MSSFLAGGLSTEAYDAGGLPDTFFGMLGVSFG
jgi:hypothetical protein